MSQRESIFAREAHECASALAALIHRGRKKAQFGLIGIRSGGRDCEDKLALTWVGHASVRCDGVEAMTAVTDAQSRDVKARAPAKAESRAQHSAAKFFRPGRSSKRNTTSHRPLQSFDFAAAR